MRMKILSALALVSVVAYAAVTPPRTITADIIRTVGGFRVFWTLPNAQNDTFVGLETPQTLTHKTIDGGSNTILNVPTSSFSGINSVPNGGTGVSSVLANAIPYGNGTGALNQTVAPLWHQVLKGNSSGVPIWGIVNLAESAAVGTTVLGIVNGGTNNGALATTAGGLIVADGSKLINIGTGTAGQIPIADGAGNTNWSNTNGMTHLIVTSTTGASPAAYMVWCSSNNVTAGATYTNNGQTFTAINTVVAGSRIVFTGTGAPTATGTLTKATGTGDATISITLWAPMVAYTPPASARVIKVTVTGGGGGSNNVVTGAVSSAAAAGGGGAGTSIKYISAPVGPYYYDVGIGGTNVSGQPQQHGQPSVFAGASGNVLVIGEGGSRGSSTCASSATTGVCVSNGTGSFAASSGGDINLQGGVSGTALVFSGTHACSGGGGGSIWCPGPQQNICDFTQAASTPSQCYGAGANGALLVNGGANQNGGTGAAGIVVIEEYY